MKVRDGVFWFALVAAAAIGFGTAKIASPSKPFSLDDKINPMQAATLLLTAGISIAFFRRFEKQKYSDKLKKDALLARLSTALGKVCTLHEQCEGGTAKYVGIVASLKKCRAEFSAYVSFASAIAHGVPEEERRAYNDNFKILRDLLTDTPGGAPIPANAPLSISNGEIHLSPNRVVEVEQKIDEIKRTLLRIETAIILEV